MYIKVLISSSFALPRKWRRIESIARYKNKLSKRRNRFCYAKENCHASPFKKVARLLRIITHFLILMQSLITPLCHFHHIFFLHFQSALADKSYFHLHLTSWNSSFILQFQGNFYTSISTKFLHVNFLRNFYMLIHFLST